jgi:hypothetical protein
MYIRVDAGLAMVQGLVHWYMMIMQSPQEALSAAHAIRLDLNRPQRATV